jgi:hypothetical protein
MPTGSSGVRLGFIVFGLVALLSGCSGRSETAPSLEGKPLSGTVDMREVQVAYLGSAGGGSGTLFSVARRIRSPSPTSASVA